ncbi:BsuBI/PstI family type II restriction endonuclease [Candidatus Parabeggiatoa sp. HSG14]|uniref:BsuBI/PstI family type II restriction endonuclease n=1 Tax=Candidatus Parabeggiatoa sp. HSG14 TaxID=3055593 RepID=UPI0025A8A5B4|nr:BsuBI/PstI family type II restriction endonuclease [Thiotrichales bacterium HSG14]
MQKMQKIPVKIADDLEIYLTPGNHNKLIKDIITEFAPRYAPGSQLIYVGDTGDKWCYFNEKILKNLGTEINHHGKMPDVILYDSIKKWLLLIEAVTSHGPIDGKRHDELTQLFGNCNAGLVYVTTFPYFPLAKK